MRNLVEEEQHVVYLAALRELYELLKMDTYLLDQFKTSPGLLKFFYLTQLILSMQVDERDIGIKLSLLLFRFDSNTKLSDITQDVTAIEVLQKHDAQETWKQLSKDRLKGFIDELPLPRAKTQVKQIQSKLTNYLSGED